MEERNQAFDFARVPVLCESQSSSLIIFRYNNLELDGSRDSLMTHPSAETATATGRKGRVVSGGPQHRGVPSWTAFLGGRGSRPQAHCTEASGLCAAFLTFGIRHRCRPGREPPEPLSEASCAGTGHCPSLPSGEGESPLWGAAQMLRTDDFVVPHVKLAYTMPLVFDFFF